MEWWDWVSLIGVVLLYAWTKGYESICAMQKEKIKELNDRVKEQNDHLWRIERGLNRVKEYHYIRKGE